ncbi:hypothetical protein DCS_08203 [Drechmeria coniospora]|uniref:Uncharacterized protein n=1 Tax=Drechmeria coniospora TaxID=98403 RepID=A0A151GGM1_DRECN|nr:hypothetical protein DCS_08203 [Drechmeria coniospora]KYK56234.1 hypothetical protein DCS_08203 [Drechmeria coniospora]
MCYSSLQVLESHWGGVKYILTALDQKSKGIWDCETYTSEEYESTIIPLLGPTIAEELRRASPKMDGAPPIAWSLAGSADSPNSSLTLMYTRRNGTVMPTRQQPQAVQALPSQVATPPGIMVYDPIRQSLPAEPVAIYPPALPQTSMSSVRHSPLLPRPLGPLNLPYLAAQPQPPSEAYDGVAADEDGRPKMLMAPSFASSGGPLGGFEAYGAPPVSAMADADEVGRLASAAPCGAALQNLYFNHGMPMPSQPPWAFGASNMSAITFDSRDIDISVIGRQPQLMTGAWIDFIPSDVLGMLENYNMDGQVASAHPGAGG